MIDLNEKQKEVIQNKINHGWEVGNINLEFNLLYGEVAEAFDAYNKKKEDLGLELADVALYLLGISEMLGFSLEEQIEKKIEINKKRKYTNKNGVITRIEG